MPERFSRVRKNMDGPKPRPELRVNIEGGPETARRAKAAGALAVPESTGCDWPEIDLDLRDARIREHVDYLNNLREQADQAGSYRNLLSGESVFSARPAGQGEISAKSILSRRGWRDASVLSMEAVLKVPGIDYRKLSHENPRGQYKFYSSFDLTTDEANALGDQWFLDVAERARAAGISLKTKSFDHAYDSLNLYTWHPAEVGGILQELYPRYRDAGLYYDTPHFLQGTLEGVDPNHIGFVQEMPASVRGNMSFSVRMGVLGEALDQSKGPINPELFTQAATVAGVDPERPYLFNLSEGSK